MKIDTDEIWRVGKAIVGTLIIVIPILWFGVSPRIDSYILEVNAGSFDRVEERINALERQLAAAKKQDADATKLLLEEIRRLREDIKRR
jgi:hypothetical protein